MFPPGKIDATTLEFLSARPELRVINVTQAEGATSGNGHAYFRSSPWASSDLLMSLRYDLAPSERGLVRSENNPVWSFPPDYITRLRSAIVKANPALAEKVNAQEAIRSKPKPDAGEP
jgi:hypothetical protein